MKLQVRAAFLVGLLILVPLATIFTALPAAAVDTYCPSGTSYSAGTCQATPSCPSGYTSVNGTSCNIAVSGSCPTGTTIAGSGECQSIPSCPLGTSLMSPDPPASLCIGPQPYHCTAEVSVGSLTLCTVIGQPNVVNVTDAIPSGISSIGNPSAVVFDPKGDLWVVDSYNSRVLEYKTPLSTGEAASLVIGQANLTDTSDTSEAGGLFSPTGLAFDSKGDLWVVDSGDDRVLEFTSPFTNGENASLVLGQSSFEGYVGHTTASGLESPAYIAFDKSGDLWVTDEGNNRVLEYTAPFTMGMKASLVLGQADFTTAGPTGGAKGLFEPVGIAFDREGDLWVADGAHHRVLEYTAPFSTDEAASVAVGQPSLTSVGSSTTLTNAFGIAFDPSGNLWVSDGISGVLEFPVPISTGEVGNEVIGPKSISTVTEPDYYTLRAPQGVTFDKANDLWIADSDHGRVLEYGSTGPLNSTSTSTTSTTSSGSGVPVFPYQFAAAAIFTVVLTASYLLVRRRATPRGNAGQVASGSA